MQLLIKGTKELYLNEENNPVQGVKVTAFYDEDSGELMTYSK
mgnify:CR=1 FL=1